jgi:uncharacterized protein
MPEIKPTAEQIIQALGLIPLPVEGGMYRESYRPAERIPAECLPARYIDREKPFGTAIYYLLTNQPDSFSEMHRLPTDEVFHFYLGDPLEGTLLYPDGSVRQISLGNDIFNSEQVQFTVPSGVWQGWRVKPGGAYALIGTTMAPGYTSGDYEGGDRAILLAQYPQASQQIHYLTR